MFEDKKMALKKSVRKVSLNIKVGEDVDSRLKRARAEARKQGMKFNVSAEVESFLLRELKKVEKTLSISQDISEELGQGDLFDGSVKADAKSDSTLVDDLDIPTYRK